MDIRVRFAPSPTGLLHVGNARTALVTWLFARKAGGRTLLRLDDTDRERSDPRFAEAIGRDLAWLGLDWDDRARQSDRMDTYEAASARLKASGRLYPCWETEEELGLKRRAQLAAGRPPVYDRAALRLTPAERAELEGEGRRPHWRFLLEHRPIEWTDLVRGPVRFEGADLSDPVLLRADGRPLYHLTSVADDADFGITHVVRGEDHVANTAAHVQMFEALGAAVPAFAHLPLILGASGEALSKRLGSLSLQSLREEQGLEPDAVTSLLARLGTADAIEPVLGLGPLVEGFSWTRFGRASPRFDEAELARLNARILHSLPFEVAGPRLAALGIEPVDPAYWAAVRPNLERLRDLAHWRRVTDGVLAPGAEDPAFTAAAAELLPPEPWDGETWDRWIGAVKAATGRSGRKLFHPLRLALTGEERGPELRALLPLIGRDRAVRRLRGEAA